MGVVVPSGGLRGRLVPGHVVRHCKKKKNKFYRQFSRLLGTSNALKDLAWWCWVRRKVVEPFCESWVLTGTGAPAPLIEGSPPSLFGVPWAFHPRSRVQGKRRGRMEQAFTPSLLLKGEDIFIPLTLGNWGGSPADGRLDRLLLDNRSPSCCTSPGS